MYRAIKNLGAQTNEAADRQLLAAAATAIKTGGTVKSDPSETIPTMPPRTLSLAEAEEIGGKLSKTTKMPWNSYDLPATSCRVGTSLRPVPGSECERCYARAGFYAFPNPRRAHAKRLDGIVHPRWDEAMEVLIRHELKKTPVHLRYFRWHSSGDVQSLDHLRKIVAVAERIPEVRFWLQTKEVADVQMFLRSGGHFPENLTVRLSSVMVGKPLHRLGLPSTVITPAGGTPAPGSYPCPATAPESTGKCGECRACWSSDVPLIAFHEHGRSARKQGMGEVMASAPVTLAASPPQASLPVG